MQKQIINQSSPQPTLFDTSEESKFEKYHAENPEVYQQFKRFAFEAINRGRKRFSAEAILNRIRWETLVSGDDGFKVNNNYRSFYARLFVKDFPKYKDFFAFRKSKADEEL